MVETPIEEVAHWFYQRVYASVVLHYGLFNKKPSALRRGRYG